MMAMLAQLDAKDEDVARRELKVMGPTHSASFSNGLAEGLEVRATTGAVSAGG